MPDTVHTRQQFDGHGVQHLVANHHAFHHLRPGLQPAHLVGMRRQGLGLPLAQGAREVNDGVVLHLFAQGIEQLQGQRTGAGAKLEHLAGARSLQGLAHLDGQGLPKQGTDERSGHKIAARCRHGAKLLQGVGVVTQTGLVQGQRHELVKRHPAASLRQSLQDALVQRGR